MGIGLVVGPTLVVSLTYIVCYIAYSSVNGFSGFITWIGEEKAAFVVLSITPYSMASFWKSFLFLLVLGKCCII